MRRRFHPVSRVWAEIFTTEEVKENMSIFSIWRYNMSGFCRDCSIAMFGKDYREFAELMKPEAYSNEKGKERGALVLCECCGPIVVDINGRRIDGQEFHKDCSCQTMVVA